MRQLQQRSHNQASFTSKLSSAIAQAFWYSILENPHDQNRRLPLALAQPSLIAIASLLLKI
ncbi:hypothetical protein [Nostoc sp.]